MKHPNGYGTVAKLSGNRRKPFVVRKTIGWNDKGHPQYKTIGYFPTREDGLIALAQYNKEPWDVTQEKTTLEELFELWIEKKATKLGKANRNSLKAAYRHCSTLFKKRYKEIKSYHMQEVIDGCGRGYSTQGAIKNLFGHLDRFALELDLITRCYSELLTSAPIPDTTKKPFIDDEVKQVWEAADEEWVDTLLVFLYTGFRISELLAIKTENVDLEVGTIKGGTKTKAGKDRIVPIHSRIEKFIIKRVTEGGKYLFMYKGKKINTTRYYTIWDKLMERFNMEHKTQECRHTLRSKLDSANANKVCIDLIMGHKSKDVGERVYTHKTVQELKNTIELITG